MYELKNNGKVITNKSIGTGPSSCEKRNLPDRCLTKVEKHWFTETITEFINQKCYNLHVTS